MIILILRRTLRRLWRMDAVNCHRSGPSPQDSAQRARSAPDTFSRLAELMACVEQRQETHCPKLQQDSFFICKHCGQEFSDLTSLGRHQQREHALRKPHCCHHCGLEFALVSSLQLHRCVNKPSVCQVCRGTPQWGSPCPSCLSEASVPHSQEEQSHHFSHRLHHDSSPYVCAPCGKAFSHKQELLYHQQAGGCQPTLLSPKIFSPRSAALSPSPDLTPTPSCATLSSVIKDYPSTCSLCCRTFRSAAGLACHRRHAHLNSLRKKENKATKELNQQLKGPSFPCRSCDKVFSQTSMLYMHRKEEHSRDKKITRQQRSSVKNTRQRRKGERYPCLHCGKVFLHHLTRWAHFRSYTTHYQTHQANSGSSGKKSTAGKDFKAAKVTKVPKAFKESHLVIKKTNEKKHLNSRTKRDQSEHAEEPEKHNEDGEFPCPSCEEVFSTQSALDDHEEIHQSSDAPNHCSVCTRGIVLPQNTEYVNRIYHCVPCSEAFVDLDDFLKHCKKAHLCTSDDDQDDGQFSE